MSDQATKFTSWKRDGDRIVLCDWDEVRKWNNAASGYKDLWQWAKSAEESLQASFSLNASKDFEASEHNISLRFHEMERSGLVELTSTGWKVAKDFVRPLIQITTDVFERLDGPVVDGEGTQWWRHENGKNARMADGNVVIKHHRELTHADLFRDLFALMDKCKNLDFEITTEWPENIRPEWTLCPSCQSMDEPQCTTILCYRPNVYLGIRAHDQATCDRRVAELAKCSDLCAGLVVDLELAGLADVSRSLGYWHKPPCEQHDRFELECPRCNLKNADRHNLLSRIKVGGQTGPDARPCNVDWIRSVVAQCEAAGVPCEVTQLGSNIQTCCHDGCDAICDRDAERFQAWYKTDYGFMCWVCPDHRSAWRRFDDEMREYQKQYSAELEAAMSALEKRWDAQYRAGRPSPVRPDRQR